MRSTSSAEYAVQPVSLLRGQRSGPRRFSRESRQVCDERLDFLVDLDGEIVDATRQADPGINGADLHQHHDQHRERDDAEEDLRGVGHT